MDFSQTAFDPITLGWVIGICILWAINAWRSK